MSLKNSSELTRKERRTARVYALQLLYSFDQKRFEDDGHLMVSDDEVTGIAEDCLAFGQHLFNQCIVEKAAVDATIDKYLKNWTIHRLAVADRSLLRLGCYELLYEADIPAKASINEYVDMAKEFGSDGKTAKLVNGVLDSIARQHRAGETNKK